MELLIMSEDVGGYEAGDILDCRPDGFSWGLEEYGNPRFVLVTVPDQDLGDTSRFLDSNDDAGGAPVDNRRWKIVGTDLVEKMPGGRTRTTSVQKTMTTQPTSRRAR